MILVSTRLLQWWLVVKSNWNGEGMISNVSYVCTISGWVVMSKLRNYCFDAVNFFCKSCTKWSFYPILLKNHHLKRIKVVKNMNGSIVLTNNSHYHYFVLFPFNLTTVIIFEYWVGNSIWQFRPQMCRVSASAHINQPKHYTNWSGS